MIRTHFFITALVAVLVHVGHVAAENPQNVPFPFADPFLEKKSESNPFMLQGAVEDVNKISGATTDSFGRTAPDPASLLRPRYQSPPPPKRMEQLDHRLSPFDPALLDGKKSSSPSPQPIHQAGGNVSVPQTLKSNPEFSGLFPKDPISSAGTGNIAAPLKTASKTPFSVNVPPVPKTMPPPLPSSSSPSPPPPAPSTVHLKEHHKSFAVPSNSFARMPANESLPQQKNEPSESYVINNNHVCDDLTCGDAGCGRSSYWLFQHLGARRPYRGYCDSCGVLTCPNKCSGPLFFDGWLAVGSFMNTHWPEDRTNLSIDFNDHNGEPVMNQLYLSFGRRINTQRNAFDLGGRLDLLYGSDYFYTSSLGLETRKFGYIRDIDDNTVTVLDPKEASLHWNSNQGARRVGTASLYGLSVPQAYAEMYVPVGMGLTLKAGHFYSGMSLESAMSPRNFFYSHSYSFMYASPITQTGATATMRLSPYASAMVGFSQGWDVFDNPAGNIDALLGLKMESWNRETSLSFVLISGKESLRGGDNRTSYTMTLSQLLTPRCRYALEHSFGYERNGSLRDLMTEERGPARWISLAQYLQCELTEKLSIGLRGEWFRDDGHSRVQRGAVNAPSHTLQGKNYFELTLGLNWRPTRCITIRPEIRYDWSDIRRITPSGSSSGIYSGGRREMVSFAIDGIVRF